MIFVRLENHVVVLQLPEITTLRKFAVCGAEEGSKFHFLRLKQRDQRSKLYRDGILEIMWVSHEYSGDYYSTRKSKETTLVTAISLEC